MSKPPPYRVLRKLGQGSMAEVLLAELGGERVALKRVLPPLRRNAKVLALFIEEARLLARLKHPNIPALVDDDAGGPEPWLALEYIDGADLAALLRSTKNALLPIEATAAIARGIAAALAHAHALRDDDGEPMRLVHRDVSPSNVLLSVTGDVLLADFGVARHDARPKMTKTGALIGKLTYMAPEQLRGAKVDARTDVFGWGVVAYEMLAGHLPYDRDDTSDPLASFGSKTLRSLKPKARVAKDLVAVIERALAIAPADRFADGAALLKALGPPPAPTADDVGPLVRAIATASHGGDGQTLVDGTLTEREDSAPTTTRQKRRR